METTGLVLSTGQTVVQLAGVAKRHVVTHKVLEVMAVSIESKAIRSSAFAEELSFLIEAPGLRSVLFAHALKDLNEIQQNLSSVISIIEKSTSIGRLLPAAVLNESLKEIDSKLSQLENFYRTIGFLGSKISSLQSEIRALVLATLTSSESIILSSEQIQQFLQKMESQTRAYSRTRNDFIMKSEARIAFAMGLTIYGDRIGKPKSSFEPLRLEELHSAARFFHKACGLGVKEAYRHLGDLYYEGHGVEICHRTAVMLYRKGAARNDAAAKYKLGWCYRFGHGVDEDSSECIRHLRAAMDAGSGEAMGSIGYFKLNGMVLPSDHSGAYQLLKKANEKGVFFTKQSMAICYEKGIGEDRDPVKAFQLYRRCFDGGFLITAIQLADCYDTGTGVARNPREATKVIERCMNSGTWYRNRFKAYFGLRLIQGNGVEKDVARGKALIIDSTKSGNAYSWNALGDCFRHGLGFRRDIGKAKEFYKKAIDSGNGIQGVVSSYIAMGEIFEHGYGVTTSIIEANKYYLGAADRLSSIGQWKAASAFENGIGMKKNIHRAVYYFRLSANSGNVRAQRKSVSYYMKGHGLERPRGYIREIMEEAAGGGSKEGTKWC